MPLDSSCLEHVSFIQRVDYFFCLCYQFIICKKTFYCKDNFLLWLLHCFFYVDQRHFNLLAHTKNTFAQKINLFLISKSVFSLSRYIFTCWHFHFLRIARTAAVACYLPYHRSSPFQIVPLHYFLSSTPLFSVRKFQCFRAF